MNITNDTEKIAIVERLVKEGAIDFTEALKLMEEPEQIYYPIVYPTWPTFGPICDWKPFEITCNSLLQ